MEAIIRDERRVIRFRKSSLAGLRRGLRDLIMNWQ